MSWRKVFSAAAIALGLLFATTLCWYAVVLCGTWSSKGKDMHLSERMQVGFPHRQGLINLNGGWLRLVGMRRCNKVIRLRNGGLLFENLGNRNSAMTDRVLALDRFLKDQGIPFVVALAPQKFPLDGSLGYGKYPRFRYNDIGDEYVRSANKNKLDLVDLRNSYAVDGTSIGQNFFKTDLHWTFDTAFDAFCTILPHLYERCGMRIDNGGKSCSDVFVRKILQRGYCGSYGKRTGYFFSGFDKDCGYYDLKSDNCISQSVPKKRLYGYGKFNDVCCRKDVLPAPKDVLFDPFYDYYENGLIPYVRYRNEYAECPRKLLVIKDSFAMPIAAFSSAMFSSVDVIDPRHDSGIDIPSYVLATRPDIVLLMFNVSAALNPESAVWGPRGGGMKGIWTLIDTRDRVCIRATESARYYARVAEFDSDGGVYRVSVPSVKVRSGYPEGLTISIQSVSQKKEVVLDTFSISHLEKTKLPIIFPFGGLPKGRYRVLIYGGVRDKTKGVSLMVEGFSLEALQIETKEE